MHCLFTFCIIIDIEATHPNHDLLEDLLGKHRPLMRSKKAHNQGRLVIVIITIEISAGYFPRMEYLAWRMLWVLAMDGA